MKTASNLGGRRATRLAMGVSVILLSVCATGFAQEEVVVERPPAQQPLGKMRVVRVRDGVAVIEAPGGELLVARPGLRLGPFKEELVSVEPDRLTLSGVRIEDGQRVTARVVLTWDGDGKVSEQRIEERPLGIGERGKSAWTAPQVGGGEGAAGERSATKREGK